MIHRDLSPDNLMITEDKGGNLRLKIIDLGLARTLETDANFEITQVGMFMGKLQYCSPEQASPGGGALDHRSDLYSFGLVLYEMIAGLPPFESENQHGFIFKRLSEDPLPLRGRNPRVEVPVELDRVVRRALERDREQRFPDARAFIDALEQVEQSLTAVETKEIPMSAFAARAGRLPAAGRSGGSAAEPRRRAAPAQLERAVARRSGWTCWRRSSGRRSGSRRARSSSPAPRPSLAAGRLDEAAGADRADRDRGPADAGARPPEGPARPGPRARGGAPAAPPRPSRCSTSYLQRKQLPLARLALETLLEIQPDHPKRADYEGWIEHLADESGRAKRAEAALAAGRAALERKDFQAARRELETIARNDPSGKRAESFNDELERAEREVRENAESERRRRRFEELIAAHRVVEAKEELDALARLDMPRVTLDFYREQLAEARAGIQREEQEAVFERRYRQSLEDHNWSAAREVARELGKTPQPGSRARLGHVRRDRPAGDRPAPPAGARAGGAPGRDLHRPGGRRQGRAGAQDPRPDGPREPPPQAAGEGGGRDAAVRGE